MAKTRALIADDDESIIWVLERYFAEKGVETVKALDGASASNCLRKGGLTLALLDINMPGKDGLAVLKEARQALNPAPVIIMTAESSMKSTLEAMKSGAFDYVTKPFDLGELDIIVERCLDNIRLKEKLFAVTGMLKERLKDESVFVGRSKAVQNVFKTIGKIAQKDVTVLVLGESGTGKELVARLIHMNSARAEGPFIALNSAAVPRELMESELFGHEKGAFTGAVEAKKGKFELADGGTLFLDEVGDMSLELQTRLLRALQEKEFYRVGGKEPVRVNVRIIAATHQDLDKAVHEKRFREDLLFRLNSVVVALPPLRDRKGDVALLSEYFMEKFSREFSVEMKSLSQMTIDALEAYHWPGNVRELENVLRRALLLSPNVVLTPQDLNLPESGRKSESLEDIITAKLKPFIAKTDFKEKQELYELVMPFMERPLIKLVLEKTKGNQVQAADVLGINRNTLRAKIKKLRINIAKLKE